MSFSTTIFSRPGFLGGRSASNRGQAREIPPSFAEESKRQVHSHVQASEIRDCRQLLRDVYALKVSIAVYRHTFQAVRHVVVDRQERAAAGLSNLMRTVDSWIALGSSEWSATELKTLQEIRSLIVEMSDPNARSDGIPHDTDTHSIVSSTAQSSIVSSSTGYSSSNSGRRTSIHPPDGRNSGSIISSTQADDVSVGQISRGSSILSRMTRNSQSDRTPT